MTVHYKVRGETARELFPLALDALARDVNSGMFRRGADLTGREASMHRVQVLLSDQEPQDQARGYLALAAAAAAIPEDAAVDQYWKSAAVHYKTVAPENTDVSLACDAVRWSFPDALRKGVVKQARQRLAALGQAAALPESLRREAAEAQADADKILSGK